MVYVFALEKNTALSEDLRPELRPFLSSFGEPQDYNVYFKLKLEKSRKNSQRCYLGHIFYFFKLLWTLLLNGLDTDRLEVELGRNYRRNSFIGILNWQLIKIE